MLHYVTFGVPLNNDAEFVPVVETQVDREAPCAEALGSIWPRRKDGRPSGSWTCRRKSATKWRRSCARQRKTRARPPLAKLSPRAAKIKVAAEARGLLPSGSGD
jgi:hypothetical protein